MERWAGKVAIVTGASSGIGAEICKDLVKAGMIVAGLARRKDRVQALKLEIPSDARGKLYAVKCDITKDDDITKAFGWVLFELGSIDVLINNAGIVRLTSVLDEGSENDMRDVLQTNLWATVMCTKRAVEIMRRQKVIGGHVININSVAGHKVPPTGPGEKPILNVYTSSKFGVTAFSEVMRQEFNYDKLKYKITSISPGMVRTEILSKDIFDMTEQYAGVLLPEDVSAAVLFALGTPPHVQIAELTIKPIGELF